MIDFSNITTELIDTIYNDYTSFITDSNNKISQMDLNDLNWSNLLQPQIDFENQFEKRRALLKLSQLHPSKDIRDRLSETDVKLAQFTLNECMRRDTYKIYKYYHLNQFQNETLTNDQWVHFTKMMRELKRLEDDEMIIDNKLLYISLIKSKFDY